MKTYKRGSYSVEVADDGAIKVKRGDWLSKYSAAIHNDFWHVHEYGRKNRQGIVVSVENVDLIFEGEILYHLPTYQLALSSAAANKSPVPPMPYQQSPRPLTDEEKKQLTLDILKRDYNLRGEELHIVTVAYEIVHYSDAAVTLGEIAGLITHGSAMATVGSVLSVASAVLLPVFASIELYNALATMPKIYGMRAVAYTTTAWAFGETPPTQSQVILHRVAHNYQPDVRFCEQAWRESSAATIRNLDSEPGKRNVSKRSFQVLLRALGDNQRSKLCLLILQGFEKKLRTSVELMAWKDGYKVEYPQ